MEFIFLFLYRSISGWQNGLGYAKKATARTIVSIVLAVAAFLPFGVMCLYSEPAAIVLLAALAGSLVSALGVIGVEESFNEKILLLPNDVHLWETLATAGVMISVAAMGGNLILILASVYPALIIHKGLINRYSGLTWWDARTDDATGRTFSIPLLNIKVPRMNTRGRQIAAVLSIAAAAAAMLIPLKVSVYDILKLFV